MRRATRAARGAGGSGLLPWGSPVGRTDAVPGARYPENSPSVIGLRVSPAVRAFPVGGDHAISLSRVAGPARCAVPERLAGRLAPSVPGCVHRGSPARVVGPSSVVVTSIGDAAG